MTESSQQLMDEVSLDNKEIISQTVLDLNDRAANLEGQAKRQQELLHLRNDSWKSYLVSMTLVTP